MTQTSTAAESAAVPPIILLVEDDPDTRDMYSVFFESEGMWVAGATNPGEAIQAVDELKPDLIVTDLGFQGQPLGLEFVDLLKRRGSTAAVPVILLSGRTPDTIPAETRAQADLCLLKPVLPADLMEQVNLLLTKSRAVRARNETALGKARDLRERSNAIIARAHGIVDRVNLTARACPGCAQSLQFIETGSIDGREYDYYHWCLNRCGLYCFDREARRWVKLAG
jgi:CheY-like chemotaxis protein